MSETPRSSWRGPSCGRQIPPNVEVCRCGSERRRLEALGYNFDTTPQPPTTSAAPRRRPIVENNSPVASIVGYRIDTDLGAGWRAVLRVLFAAAVIAAGWATVHLTHTAPDPTRDNIQVQTTLEDFTRRAGPTAGNTIPAFLAATGSVGVLKVSGARTDPVRRLIDADLRQGFCSQSIAAQVRREYPGYYDDWPDDKLERTVLEKYPEYVDRLCVLSIRLDASPGEIIKYELKPRSLLGLAGLWLRTLLITMVFAVGCLNLYYRVIIGRFASAE